MPVQTFSLSAIVDSFHSARGVESPPQIIAAIKEIDKECASLYLLAKKSRPALRQLIKVVSVKCKQVFEHQSFADRKEKLAAASDLVSEIQIAIQFSTCAEFRSIDVANGFNELIGLMVEKGAYELFSRKLIRLYARESLLERLLRLAGSLLEYSPRTL